MKLLKPVALAMCLILSMPSWAQPNPGGGGWGGGPGPGMMGPGMMGPGMMGGYYGGGSGMMGYYGGGPGMMGGCGMGFGWNFPALSPEQRNKVTDIQRDLRRKQWELMDKMHDNAQFNPYQGGKFDEQAARKAFDVANGLHKQMFENCLDAQKRTDALLTPQQREQLQKAWGGR